MFGERLQNFESVEHAETFCSFLSKKKENTFSSKERK